MLNFYLNPQKICGIPLKSLILSKDRQKTDPMWENCFNTYKNSFPTKKIVLSHKIKTIKKCRPKLLKAKM